MKNTLSVPKHSQDLQAYHSVKIWVRPQEPNDLHVLQEKQPRSLGELPLSFNFHY